jgi:hypothetical protein
MIALTVIAAATMQASYLIEGFLSEEPSQRAAGPQGASSGTFLWIK